ncbi:MAG: hypothetical protein HQL74_01595 [Magnetococcales bacterium]|nr:hypothetical protein [Magnetococcales bacterium]
MFPKTPAITCYDPLADFLGAGGAPFTYTFDDAVKLSGHACPTIAGAFLMAKRALELLYPDTMPQRGDIAITVPDSVDAGVIGPITQILTLVTGAAANNGFKGLGDHFNRMNLMRFREEAAMSQSFLFERLSTGKQVRLQYNPHAFPPSPKIAELLPLLLADRATTAQKLEFARVWRQRVLDILQDGGTHTVFQV